MRPIKSLLNHRSMLMLLLLWLLFSTIVLRMLWQTEALHQERRMLAQQQVNAASLLYQSDSQQHATDLWNLHWAANQTRFRHYSDQNHWPRLHTIYNEAPYSLNQRFAAVSIRANDSKPTDAALSYGMLMYGLQAVADQLNRKPHHFKKVLLIATLLLAPLLLLWLICYHALVYTSLRRQSAITTDQLIQRDDQLDTLTFSDPLTATANRKAITQYLSEYQQSHSDSEDFIALAVLDIDYFQQINDVFGYFAGDAVLKEVAARIEIELREDDMLGRIDADHFAIVLCNLVAPKNAEQIIERIQHAIAQPVQYRNNMLNVTCTVGATVQRSDTLELAELFKLSNQALLQAKQNRRGSVFLLSDKQQEALTRQRSIINTIKSSALDDIFELAYQPIVNLKTREIEGCECLLRWKANDPADIQTSELVPILEMFGDIKDVGHWVLEQSMRRLNEWQHKDKLASIFTSINLSARQLEDEYFAQQIIDMAKQYGIPPEQVTLELTETVAVKQLEAGSRQLARLRNHGFKLSLDDFGTGYSSLQYLKKMPATTVKIDQSFVTQMHTDTRDMAIVEGAIAIAKSIGLSVVAEGIDTPEQALALQSLGCDRGQGYLFGKPLDAATFEQRATHGAATVSNLKNPPAA